MGLVNTIRLIEDGLGGTLLLTIALVLLVKAAYGMRNMPSKYAPISLIIGLIPLYIWKVIGFVERAFFKNDTLHMIKEAFESISGIILAVAVLFLLLKLKGVFDKK